MLSKVREHKENKDDSKLNIDKEIIKSSVFMDLRIPYNYEYIIPSLLKELIKKKVISIDEARQIMSSGESYLH